jgi:mannose-6-phosphate isomerase-like protein (cupin superfamily)
MEVMKVNLTEKLKLFSDCWRPRIIGELNGQYAKLARLDGEFVWHCHEKEDELFLVLTGTLEMHLRDKVEVLGEGEMIVIPRGVEHKPVAREKAEVLLFEPKSTINTGQPGQERTVEPEWI